MRYGNRVTIVTALACVLAFGGYAEGLDMQVVRLRCEYLENPIGIDTAAPRLSWALESGRRGARQTAYQVLAAGDAVSLAADKGDLWDSGRMASDTTVLIPYGGQALTPKQTVHWKVRVWDETGAASAWSAPARFETGLIGGAWQGDYIGLNAADGNVEFPWLRTRFELPSAPVRARAYVNPLGYAELYINGDKAGDDVLTPAVSQFNKRSWYLVYDITPLLRGGANTAAFWLGRGWYAEELPGVAYPGPLVRAFLEIACEDGSTVIMPTGGDWKAHPSHYRRIGEWHSGRYGGEHVDAQAALNDWAGPDFDDSEWPDAAVAAVPDHAVASQPCEPNRILRRFAPRMVKHYGGNAWLVDFGVNLSGWFEMTLRGQQPGAKVTMDFIDHLSPEMKNFNQRSIYVARGGDAESFRNRFHYHAFRYVLIKGLDAPPAPEDLAALLIRTDFPVYASFACSNPLLTEIHDMVHYTFECLSLGGYLVDCPHIERLGYGGDGQASTATALSLFGMGPLYTAWMAHWRDCQRPDGGLPHTAPNPYSAGGGPYWCAFSIAAPWELYRHYGDVRILEENYAMMQRWLDGYVAAHSREDGLLWGWPDEEYRNWYLGDWARPKRNESEAERSTHLVNNCVIIESHARMAQIATLLGKADDAARYAAAADALRTKVHAEFWHDGAYADDTQLDLAYPLLAGVTPPDLQQQVEQRLDEKIRVTFNGHLDVGLVGVPILTTALLERGRSDLVFDYTNQEDFPGWGYMLRQGATATWEHWDGMRSHIHNCYNGIGVWFYQALAGIRLDPMTPAFARFVLKPEIVGDVTWVKARQDTVRGVIESAWEIKEEQFRWQVRVPANTAAEAYVPGPAAKVTESGKAAAKAEGVKFLREEAGRAVFEIQPGQYTFEAPYK